MHTHAHAHTHCKLSAGGRSFRFDRLCLCTGARPRELLPRQSAPSSSPCHEQSAPSSLARSATAPRDPGVATALRDAALTIRDTESARRLEGKLQVNHSRLEGKLQANHC